MGVKGWGETFELACRQQNKPTLSSIPLSTPHGNAWKSIETIGESFVDANELLFFLMKQPTHGYVAILCHEFLAPWLRLDAWRDVMFVTFSNRTPFASKLINLNKR